MMMRFPSKKEDKYGDVTLVSGLDASWGDFFDCV
jgi:hypothetical protein